MFDPRHVLTYCEITMNADRYGEVYHPHRRESKISTQNAIDILVVPILFINHYDIMYITEVQKLYESEV